MDMIRMKNGIYRRQAMYLEGNVCQCHYRFGVVYNGTEPGPRRWNAENPLH